VLVDYRFEMWGTDLGFGREPLSSWGLGVAEFQTAQPEGYAPTPGRPGSATRPIHQFSGQLAGRVEIRRGGADLQARLRLGGELPSNDVSYG